MEEHQLRRQRDSVISYTHSTDNGKSLVVSTSKDDVSTLENYQDSFHQNAKLIKIQQQNLLQRIRQFSGLIALCTHTQFQKKLEKYVDSTDKLRKQVLKLNPQAESYNDIVSTIAIRESQVQSLTKDYTNNSSSNSPFKFSNSVIGSSEDQNNGVFEYENKFSKLVEQYEYDVISNEINEDQKYFNGLKTMIIEELKQYEGIKELEKQEELEFELILHYLQFEESTQRYIDIYKASALFNKNRYLYRTKYQKQILQKVKDCCIKLTKLKHVCNFYDDIINSQATDIDDMNKEIQMFTIAQPKHQAKIETLYQQLKQEILQLQQQSFSIYKDLENYNTKIGELVRQNLNIKQAKLQFQKLDNQLNEQESIIKSEIEQKARTLFLLFNQLRDELARSDLYKQIESQLEKNQQITTDAALYGFDTTKGMEIEKDLLMLGEEFEKVEEEKGFLEVEDEDLFIRMFQHYAAQIYDHEDSINQQKNASFLNQRTQDFNNILEQFQSLENQIIQVKNNLLELQTSFTTKLTELRKTYSESNHNYSQRLFALFKRITKLNDNFRKIQDNKVQDCYTYTYEQLIEQKLNLSQDIDGSLIDVGQVKEELKAIAQESDEVKVFIKQLEFMIFSSPSSEIMLQPLVLGDQFTKYDKKLYEILNDEQDNFHQQNQHVQQPILYQMQVMNDMTSPSIKDLKKTKSSQNFGIYSILGYTGCQGIQGLLLGLEDYNQFKLKFLDDEEHLAIKMRSGFYMRIDKLGFYKDELQLPQKYGFSVINLKKQK
ncbi:UNKNOWN [Stylonychia lemnae]|uniref:Uncharacterized protein n=1 Tax=Stylonychia lemnae TaxID=5949 RepID=A0A078B1E6_STYLE|nr:UNKNOWN [Stylonychia lemnae]|eukprot:CDW88141.1 UNKNOWN [Stylonychia lemnae]